MVSWRVIWIWKTWITGSDDSDGVRQEVDFDFFGSGNRRLAVVALTVIEREVLYQQPAPESKRNLSGSYRDVGGNLVFHNLERKLRRDFDPASAENRGEEQYGKKKDGEEGLHRSECNPQDLLHVSEWQPLGESNSSCLDENQMS